MSRRNIIIAVIIVVLLGAAAGYYFLYYTEESEQLTEDATQVTQEETVEDQNGEATEEATSEEQDSETGEPQSIEEELAESQEIEYEQKYAYRQEIRNPFGNIQQEQPEIQREEITIPFRLDGIIENGNQRLAVISTQEGPRYVSGNESIGEYYISNVGSDQISIRYRYITVKMKIGGALVE
jgi:hypothetical protein